jgi:hypothetical protein
MASKPKLKLILNTLLRICRVWFANGGWDFVFFAGSPRASRLRKMGERYDYLFKFIVIGDAATGKSCLLHRFIENKCAFFGGLLALNNLFVRFLSLHHQSYLLQSKQIRLIQLESNLALESSMFLANTSSCRFGIQLDRYTTRKPMCINNNEALLTFTL